jgi:hypothetical protein
MADACIVLSAQTVIMCNLYTGNWVGTKRVLYRVQVIPLNTESFFNLLSFHRCTRYLKSQNTGPQSCVGSRSRHSRNTLCQIFARVFLDLLFLQNTLL